MELVAKLTDAASMFWLSLDQRERVMIGYAAAWVALVVFAGARRRDRDRLKRELLEELVAGGGSIST